MSAQVHHRGPTAERELNSCRGKVTFQSFGAAERYARRQRRRKHVRATPYHCRVCQKFHVGEPVERRGDRRRQH